ncbi:unnamed protein product [Candida verbasci]|uniref:Nitrogen regulatory protein areA GATA-like domain-containing protein n=1 Tax=Candida verbasci TaxID=1227364 RepID=A0A9W4XBQ0_9ASCO|nr:unnamed protein product [Candida verbasci]
MSVFHSDVTKSQHVDAESDQHFENTTFKLKRTRSLGLLDEFIPDKQQEEVSHDLPPPIETDTTNTTTEDESSDQDSISISSPIYNLQSPELIPHDDTDLTVEPSRHVDYLSHQWDVSDIWKSWRYVISKKKNVTNAARLENASWRTWAQRRSNLKTVSPEIVNWSKDCDVTWLYGPIMNDDSKYSSNHDENHHDDDYSTATSAVAGDISIPKKKTSYNHLNPKPILKKRTIEESIISHSNLLKLQLATQLYNKKKETQHPKIGEDEEYLDVNALSNKLNNQYKNNDNQPNDNIAKFQNLLNDNIPKQEPKPIIDKKNRHIHFNDEVQQCVAVDNFSDEYDDEFDDYDYEDSDYEDYNYLNESHYETGPDEEFKENLSEDDGDDDEDDDDEDDDEGFILNVKSNKQKPLIHRSGTTSSIDSNPHLSKSKSYTSIQLMPSTTLNYGSDDESSDEENPYTSSLSHNVNNDISRGYDYYYDYNSIYTCDPNFNYQHQQPDIVDVPESLEMGSNYYNDIPQQDPSPLSQPTSPHQQVSQPQQTSPLFLAHNNPPVNKSPFQLSDSGSDSEIDSDEEEGLSIGTRRSSQQLAESIFHNGITKKEEEPQPNPIHRSNSIFKQPSSSNSLSQSFFNNSSFSEKDKELSKTFLGNNEKSSVLPPQTTSENAIQNDISSSSSSDDDGLILKNKSYNTLNEVLKNNGGNSPSLEQQGDNDENNLVGHAKGLAKHFFG